MDEMVSLQPLSQQSAAGGDLSVGGDAVPDLGGETPRNPSNPKEPPRGPLPGRCGARLRCRPGHCQRYPVAGRTRCPNHGGKTPRGAASPHFKNGRYSAAMPRGLREQYECLLDDKTLGSLREDIATTEALIMDALSQMEGKRGAAYAVAREVVLELMDLKRKLAESEAHRLKDARMMISVELALSAMRALVTAVTQNIRDPQVIALIESEFLRLTS